MSTADAVDREVAWMTTSGDGLPGLLTSVGGPFDTVRAYQPRTPATQQTSLYVLRPRLKDARFADIQKLITYDFRLRVVWPIRSSTGSAEDEQRAMDAAIGLVVARIRGPQLDKSHGSRFLSVAENPADITVDFDDPEHTIPAKTLRAEITYSGDDFVINA